MNNGLEGHAYAELALHDANDEQEPVGDALTALEQINRCIDLVLLCTLALNEGNSVEAVAKVDERNADGWIGASLGLNPGACVAGCLDLGLDGFWVLARVL